MASKNYKNRIMLWGSIGLLALTSFLGACSSDEWDSSDRNVPSGGRGNVLLNVTVPALSNGGNATTRSVTETDENTINDLYVLAFEEDGSSYKYKYFVKAQEAAGNVAGSRTTNWVAALKVSDKKQIFSVIANAEPSSDGGDGGILDKINGLTVDDEKDAVLAELTTMYTTEERIYGLGFKASGTGKANHRPFTMYGETAAMDMATKQDISVNLCRIMARVQVKFSNSLSGFTPKAVYLYNYNIRANVCSTTTLSIPDDAMLTKGPVAYNVTDGDLMHDIYLFETAQPTTGTEAEKHVKRPCIVVAGNYNGATELSYYRVDFYNSNTKTFLNVLRNYSYVFTVVGVKGKGQSTAEDAFNSTSSNLEATVIEWNNADIGNISFDSENFLGIGTMKYELKKVEANALVQKVTASDGLEWKAELLNVKADGTADTTNPDWIGFGDTDTDTKTTMGVGTGNAADLLFKVADYPETTGERKAIMRFTAKNLKIDALVVQGSSVGVFINVDTTPIEFLQAGGTNTLVRNIEFGPENVTLTWKIIPTQTNGMSFTSALTGEQTNDANTSTGNMAWQATADAMQGVDNVDYATHNATLVLIAMSNATGEVATKQIPLFQKKYGLTLHKSKFSVTGQDAVIYVKSNFDWKCVMSDPNNITGSAAPALCKPDLKGSDTGVVSDVFNNENAKLTIETIKPTDTQSRTNTVKLTFTSTDSNYPWIKVEKDITLTTDLLVEYPEGSDIWYKVSQTTTTGHLLMTTDTPTIPDNVEFATAIAKVVGADVTYSRELVASRVLNNDDTTQCFTYFGVRRAKADGSTTVVNISRITLENYYDTGFDEKNFMTWGGIYYPIGSTWTVTKDNYDVKTHVDDMGMDLSVWQSTSMGQWGYDQAYDFSNPTFRYPGYYTIKNNRVGIYAVERVSD